MSDKKNTKQTMQESLRDRYDTSNQSYFEANRQIELRNRAYQEQPSYLTRKFNRIFGGLGRTGKNFALGFIQGTMIGTVIGAVTGTIVGIQTRRVSMFFATCFGSAVSFGFIMGIGYLIRAHPNMMQYSGKYPTGKEWIIKMHI